MRVIVTGGTGQVGREAVARLIEHGHSVLTLGRRPDMSLPGSDYAQCDVTDFNRLRDCVEGADTVAHLAAIPNSGAAPGPEIFRANAIGTFNVFEACRTAGIRRVVQASSINALGCFFGTTEFRPKYFPIDEEHPTHTTDPYSFSKTVIENIADYYWRRDGISSVSLRFPYVHPADPQSIDRLRFQCRQGTDLINELLAMEPEERRRRIDSARKLMLEFRALRPMEAHTKAPKWRELNPMDSTVFGMYFGGAYNLWTHVDARDAAQAIEQGLTESYEGSHTLFVNNRHNTLQVSSRVLGELFFPEVTDWRAPMAGTESLVSIERAHELLKFEPEFEVP